MAQRKQKNCPPKVDLPIQGLAENRFNRNNDYWAAATLVEWCKEKKYPVFDMPLAGINLECVAWSMPTAKDFIYHMKRSLDADLKYPIIIDDYGYICDGHHRVAKAIASGHTTIKAIRIQEMPLPDGHEPTKDEN